MINLCLQFVLVGCASLHPTRGARRVGELGPLTQAPQDLFHRKRYTCVGCRMWGQGYSGNMREIWGFWWLMRGRNWRYFYTAKTTVGVVWFLSCNSRLEFVVGRCWVRLWKMPKGKCLLILISYNLLARPLSTLYENRHVVEQGGFYHHPLLCHFF